MNFFIGVDPGQSGAISVLDEKGVYSESFSANFKDMTDKDIHIAMTNIEANSLNSFAMIESVHSMPSQGVASSFKFGRHFGLLTGLLYASGIPFAFVTPQKWQKAMGCMTHGDKNISKSMAQRLFPNAKITHANADSILIAEYCRITRKEAWKP